MIRTVTAGIIALYACVVPILAYSNENYVLEKDTKKQFPKEMSIEWDNQKHDLSLTGLAVRKKFFVNVYAIGHYMEDPITGDFDAKVQEILTDGKPKMFLIDWAHAAEAKKVREGFHESFIKILSIQDMQAISEPLQIFLGFYQNDIQVNDQHEMRWLPGNVLEVYFNKVKQGSITNPIFVKALWNVWFGPTSSVNKEKLVSFPEK